MGCSGSRDPWYCLTSKLKIVKNILKLLNASHGNWHNRVKQAQAELADFQNNLGSNPSNADLTEERRLCEALATELNKEEKFLKQKSRVHWMKYGDGNNKFFFNSTRGRWNLNKIMSIEDDNGDVHTNHTDISTTAMNYFNSILGCKKEVQCFPHDLNLNVFFC